MPEAPYRHPPCLTSAWIESLFLQCFEKQYHTRLVGGAHEPFYQAAQEPRAAQIFYRSDYVSSALHEVAHWCIAGAARRRLDDYGYWYAADGRDLDLQKQFEAVEVKPQALEMLFSEACGISFRVSVDNLALPDYDSGAFAQQVAAQARLWTSTASLPSRAACWLAALAGGKACSRETA